MWFRRRSRRDRLGIAKKGDPPNPPLVETSVGTFELSYGISVGVSEPRSHPIYLNIVVYEYRDGERQHDDLWQDDVANVSDLIELLHQTGMPDDEAEAVARLRFGEAVRYVREAWPDLELQVDPDERSST